MHREGMTGVASSVPKWELCSWPGRRSCLGLSFSFQAGITQCKIFFSSHFSVHWKRSPCLLLQNAWLDQIPRHCFVKTVFNVMTEHWVSYWVTSWEPFSITLCAGEKKKFVLGMAYLCTGFWRRAWMVACRKTSNDSSVSCIPEAPLFSSCTGDVELRFFPTKRSLSFPASAVQ